MKFLKRSSQAGRPRQSKGKLAQLGSAAAFLILGYEALHLIAPVSLVVLQLLFAVCQVCVNILRIHGV